MTTSDRPYRNVTLSPQGARKAQTPSGLRALQAQAQRTADETGDVVRLLAPDGSVLVDALPGPRMTAARSFTAGGDPAKTVEASPSPGGWTVAIGRLEFGTVLVEAQGYSWTSVDGVQGECMTLVEAVSQLVGVELSEVIS